MRPLVQANPRYAAPICALDVRVEADRAELARARYPGQPTPTTPPPPRSALSASNASTSVSATVPTDRSPCPCGPTGHAQPGSMSVSAAVVSVKPAERPPVMRIADCPCLPSAGSALNCVIRR